MSKKGRYGFVDGKGSYGAINRQNPRSIHYRNNSQLSTRMSTRNNVLASTRSIFNQAGVKKVNTLLKDNVRLFTAEQLDAEGLLYMKEEAFYNRNIEPEFALSMSPYIYRKMVDEVNDSHALPLKMYFCCHGGDGAHTGVAHEDFVDIGVAYVIVGIFFVVLIALVIILPNPDAAS